MTQNDKAKVLVTGATGMQGGAVAHALLRAGHPVTALVRNPDAASAQALLEQGAALAIGDLEDVASLEAAGVGHDAVFSVQRGGSDPADHSEIRQATNVVTAAQRAGITQIIQTTVSGTGWRTRYPEAEADDPLLGTYWNHKEGAEEAVRRSGLTRWTIVKPAWFMDNYLQPWREFMFPEMPQGKLVVASQPQMVLPLINADDFGAAVAAAVAEPDRFHQAEIDLASDALTYPQMAEILTRAIGREMAPDFISLQERIERSGGPVAFSDVWNDRVGYSARPHLDAAKYALKTTTFEEWAPQQDWSDLTV